MADQRTPSAARQLSRARGAWMLFDWAAQPYHTLITAFIFAPYFATGVVGDPVRGQEIWGLVQGATGFVIAVSAPVIGALSDRSGRLKSILFAVSVIYVVGCLALWQVQPGAIIIASLAVAAAGFAIEIAAVLTNALLTRLAAPGRIGALSGSAWALGFVGGLISLGLVLTLLTPFAQSQHTIAGIEPLFGLTALDGGPARASGPFSAIWYVIFVMPFFIFLPSSLTGTARTAGPRLAASIMSLSSQPGLLRFLAARLAYQDALLAVFAFGGIYGAGTLGWGPTELGLFGILLTVTGAIGAQVGGRLDDILGARPVVVTAIIMCLAALALIASIAPPGQPAHSLFSRPQDQLFLVGGTLIGIAAGPLQSASRTFLARLAPPQEMAAAFGLYALSGKAISFTGPLLVAFATWVGGTQRAGLVPIAILFIIGAAVLVTVPNKRSRTV